MYELYKCVVRWFEDLKFVEVDVKMILVYDDHIGVPWLHT